MSVFLLQSALSSSFKLRVLLELSSITYFIKLSAPKYLFSLQSSSFPVVGIVVGVLVAVLAAAGVLAGVLVIRRRRATAGVVTMSKILEDSEARGSILEEAEVTITSSL